jgi:hypothetical protein
MNGGDGGFIEERLFDAGQFQVMEQILLHALYIQALKMCATDHPGGERGGAFI